MSGTQAASLKRRRERVEHYSPRAEQHLARGVLCAFTQQMDPRRHTPHA